MPSMLIRYALAMAITCAGTSAWSAGIPDYGTKNFSPGSDAPSYFSNENGAFLGAAASESTDDGSDDGICSTEASPETDYSVSTGPRHHSRIAYTGRSGFRGASRDRSLHFASARSTRSMSTSRYERSAHSAGAAQSATKARMPRIGGGYLGKPSLRHASVRFSSHRG